MSEDVEDALSEVDLLGDAVAHKPGASRAQVKSREWARKTGDPRSARAGLKQLIPSYRAMRFGQLPLYRSEFCLIAYETLCEGRTLAGVAAQLGVSKISVLRWRKDHPEFEDAIGRGLAVAEDMWAETKWADMHPGVYKMQMGQRFDWREKTDSKVDGQLGFTLIQNLGGAPALGCDESALYDDGDDFIEHDQGTAE